MLLGGLKSDNDETKAVVRGRDCYAVKLLKLQFLTCCILSLLAEQIPCVSTMARVPLFGVLVTESLH